MKINPFLELKWENQGNSVKFFKNTSERPNFIRWQCFGKFYNNNSFRMHNTFHIILNLDTINTLRKKT